MARSRKPAKTSQNDPTPGSEPPISTSDSSSDESSTDVQVDDVVTLSPPDADESSVEESIDSGFVEPAETPVTATIAPIAPPPRRSSFFPLLLGGVVSAGLGAGATLYAVPKLWPSTPPVDAQALTDAIAAERLRIDTLEGNVSALAADADTTQTQIAAAQADFSATTAAELASLNDSVKVATARISAIDTALNGIEDRLSTLEKRPVSDGSASATALEAFGREMEAMRAEIAAQRFAADQIKTDISETAAAASARISKAEEDARQLRDEAQAVSQVTARQAALSQLQSAIDGGGSLAESLSELKSAGIEIPAALSDQVHGVPTLASLRSAFPEAARNALKSSLQENAGEGRWETFTAFLRSQSGARSLTPRAGDDPDAVLSRAEAALTAGDLKLAVDELNALPPSGHDMMAEWTARAERRIASVAALAELSAAMNE